VANEFGWHLEAWAIFSNHYHFVGHSPAMDDDAKSLEPMLRKLHSKTSAWVNSMDGAAGRQVWHNYWDTRLTHLGSYLARLNYVHNNAVKHGLVECAGAYPWCSAAWFESTATPAQVKTIYGLDVTKLRVYDEFDPAPEW